MVPEGLHQHAFSLWLVSRLSKSSDDVLSFFDPQPFVEGCGYSLMLSGVSPDPLIPQIDVLCKHVSSAVS